MKESQIQSAILAAVNADGRVRLVRNNTGECPSTHVVYGLGLGGADLVGMVRATGRGVAIEVKSARGVVRPAQRAWRVAFLAFGGAHAVCRSVEEAMAFVESVCPSVSP